MTRTFEIDNAREIIRAEVVRKLHDICKDLESLDRVFSALGLKGSQADCNLRTAALALNAAAMTA